MKKKNLQMITAVLLAAMLMGGCGEKSYELTDEERELIAGYSAHVVTKYNTYQKEGLVRVIPEETEEVETEQEEQNMAEKVPDNETQIPIPDATEILEDAEPVAVSATLAELFGTQEIEIAYRGASLVDSYMEDGYYALYPDAGKQFLVLQIDVTNIGEEPVEIDYLTDTTEFQVILNGGDANVAEPTILTDDFSTFQAELNAGETSETVLLFQVSAIETAVETVELVVNSDQKYQINLTGE